MCENNQPVKCKLHANAQILCSVVDCYFTENVLLFIYYLLLIHAHSVNVGLELGIVLFWHMAGSVQFLALHSNGSDA